VEKASQPLKIPIRRDVIELNRRHIETTGGAYFEPDNLINAGSLEWVLDAIRHPLCGIEQYPTLAEKAALLAWVIIREHVFFDGCKRTGMSAMEIFIRLNGYQLDATDEEILEIALRIAGKHGEGDFTLEDLIKWLRDHLNWKSNS